MSIINITLKKDTVMHLDKSILLLGNLDAHVSLEEEVDDNTTISSTAACYVYVTHNMSAADEGTNFERCLNEVTAGL
jgi:hypothetical protein